MQQGIGDRIDITEPAKETENGTSPRPDTLVLEICLLGVLFTSYLALHFFRKNGSKTGNIVMTSSIAGLYAAPGVSVYGAATHGVS
jgi:15-hydroxyprostaglandin dehydrogenase (NAD)